MNGKKAKMLRKQVKPVIVTQLETIYEDKNKRHRNVSVMKLRSAHFGGNPMRNTNNSGISHYVQVNTYTRELVMCPRKLYQNLKSQYLHSIRAI